MGYGRCRACCNVYESTVLHRRVGDAAVVEGLLREKVSDIGWYRDGAAVTEIGTLR